MRVLSGAALVALLGFAALPGCGGTGQVEVEGKVRYDGQPIKAGTIAFVALDKEGRGGGGTILDGKYHILPKDSPTAGKYRVEIRWPKPTGKKYKSETGATLEATEEGLPAKYHDSSELTADLKRGKNSVDFDLKK